MTSLCNSPVNLKILWPSDVINPFPKIWGLLKWFWIMLCVASPAKSVLDTHGWFSIFLVGENHQLRGVWELDCCDLVILLSTRNGTTGLSSLQLLVFSREFLVTKVAERNANLSKVNPMAPGFFPAFLGFPPLLVGKKRLKTTWLSVSGKPSWEEICATRGELFRWIWPCFRMFLLVGCVCVCVFFFGDGYISPFFCSRLSACILGIFVLRMLMLSPVGGVDEMEIFLFLVGIRMDTLFFPEWLWKDFKRFVSLWESWRSPLEITDATRFFSARKAPVAGCFQKDKSVVNNGKN